ncbi:hypothetical protein [Arsukibacterium sp.]|uniref:hypothetical protein n=1 Tax=Arsukibacterium sp. TaxID=1977258 RepID=UPI00299D7CA0|nr:hypothetical protein [Arsukibacterium sp.]MDX1537120.1 hypothetical protein [Arsukibacterium sp.]
MSSLKPPKSIFFAAAWMSLSVFVALAGYVALFDKAPFAMFGLFTLSILLFVVGLQRTERFYVNQGIFNSRIRILGFAAALCGIGTVFYAATV